MIQSNVVPPIGSNKYAMIFQMKQDITVVILILYVSYEPYSKGIFGAIRMAQSNTLGKYTLCHIGYGYKSNFTRILIGFTPVILVNVDSAPSIMPALY